MKKAVVFGWVVLISVLSGCASWSQNQPGKVQHVVLLWFKPEISENYIHEVSENTQSLLNIPGIQTLHTGRAITSDRPMVDDSFDLGVTMTFDSVASMQSYVSHPEHKAFLKRYIIGKTEKLVIYDYQ
ncbi:Dabb family protein [Litoribrevibacter euphylliae]|uniref:Dabb family protein n=1 Tax=Litoribrevibacter euphylliae TaxID=1834034 RepID=A0ABV7HEX6_9GAMM